MKPAAWVNGEPAETLHLADRGLQYGDGLFETLRCERGAPRWLERHLRRLRQGCQRLHLPLPDEELLAREVHELAAGHVRGLAKIIYTRGSSAVRGYAPREAAEPTRILSWHPWPEPAAHWVQGFRVGLATLRLGENPALAGIKHLNRLEQVLAAAEATRLALDEVLLAASSGDWISGSMSNLFLIEGQRLITPPLERCGVEGIMRGLVLERAAELGWEAAIEPIPTVRLAAAPCMFLSNVRLGLQCVHSLEGRSLLPDPRLTRLQELLDVRS